MSGTNGSSGFGSVSIEQMDSKTGGTEEIVGCEEYTRSSALQILALNACLPVSDSPLEIVSAGDH